MGRFIYARAEPSYYATFPQFSAVEFPPLATSARRGAPPALLRSRSFVGSVRRNLLTRCAAARLILLRPAVRVSLCALESLMRTLRLGIVVTAISFVFSLTGNAQQPSTHTPALDVTAMDRSIDPCVDFFAYSCGGWI